MASLSFIDKISVILKQLGYNTAYQCLIITEGIKGHQIQIL